jgi:hypothetical protein
VSARQQVVDLIKAGLEAANVDPMPDVKGYAASLDITQPTVLVAPERITPMAAAPRGSRTYVFSVLAIASQGIPTEEGEAQLDDLVADVLDALDAVVPDNLVTWSTAERSTYMDKAPAYLITATTHLPNTDD